MVPTNDKPYISKAEERYASNKDGQKTIVIWNRAVSLSISVSPTIAEQAIIDDFDIKVSRGSSESRRRTLLAVYHNDMKMTVWERIQFLTFNRISQLSYVQVDAILAFSVFLSDKLTIYN